jgi:peptide/nickel transport system substrate-binding protein
MAEYLSLESLLYTDWQGRYTPLLAAAWNWEDDGLSLVLRLRPGATFHDGRPVTSELAAGILRRAATNSIGFQYVKAIETPDDLTIVFRLSQPDAFLLDTLAGTAIVDGDIGTGPYKIRARTPTIESDRNEQYYRGKPGFAHISIVPYDRQRTAWAAMMRGEVDMLQEASRESVDFLLGASEVKTYSSIRPFYIPLVFNLRHPILRQVEVRRALAEAIDREEIVNQAMRGRGMIASDPIWPFHWAYSAAARRHAHNPGTATMRLDSAGYRMGPVTSGRMTSRFTLRCLFWREGPQFERIALLLQRQLATAGVDLILEPVSLRDLQTRVLSGDFDTYLMFMNSGRTFQRTYQFWHSPSKRGNQVQDPGYDGVDAILDRLRTARSEADVRAAVADLRQRFYEDVPAAFLAWPETTRAVDVRFDIAGDDTPDIIAEIWRWRPASNVRAAQ